MIELFRDPIWQFIGAALAFIAIIVSVVTVVVQQRKKSLAYEILARTPLLTVNDEVKGKTKEEAETIFGEFHAMVTGELDIEIDENNLGKLKIFSGVLEFPARVKCASLSWHTLNATSVTISPSRLT